MINSIKEMHTIYGIHGVTFGGNTEKLFRVNCMLEEITEYAAAPHGSPEALDALVDLVIFALGTADREGFLEVFEEAFRRVHVANLEKEVGPNTKRGSYHLDLRKPEGWRPPYLGDLL